jgi:hypothetical protein
MKKLSLSLLALLLVSQSFAQRRKTAFVEILGNGLIVSGNFEMRLKKDSNSGSGLRAGLGGGNISGYDNNGNYVSVGLITIPLGYNYLIGEKRSSFELGAGITPIIVSASGNFNGDFVSGKGITLSGVLNAGYRYQPLNSGFMGKITWTPLATNSGFYAAYFGIGLGYSFK